MSRLLGTRATVLALAVTAAASVSEAQPPFVLYRAHGFALAPYTGSQSPHARSAIGFDQLVARMTAVAPYTNWYRTYGTVDGLQRAGEAAHSLGRQIAMGAWISADLAQNAVQMTNLIAAAQAGQVDIAVIGSETMLFRRVSELQLIGYINQFKAAVPSVPVAVADSYAEFLNRPALVAAGDILMPHYYPFWSGYPFNSAVAVLHSWHQQVKAIAGTKPVVVGETGWPTAGQTVGGAVPSESNAAQYFLNFVSWARQTGTQYFYHEAYDQAWKIPDEGAVGGHWGVWTENFGWKPGMDSVFRGNQIPDNWSGGSEVEGPGDDVITLAYVPPLGTSPPADTLLRGRVLHVRPVDVRVAVFIQVAGGWWTKPTLAQPLTTPVADGSWSANIWTGGNDQAATRVVAYLVAATSAAHVPALTGQSVIPAFPFLASVETGRTLAAITGRIVDSFGSALSGVTVAVSGPQTQSVLTNANGLYSVPALVDGSYVVTPSRTGFNFNPVQRSFGFVTTLTTADFTATALPGTPAGPTPADGAVDVSPLVTLSANVAAAATSYELYLGTTNPPPFAQGGAATPSFPVGPLLANTQYFWRIGARNTNGAANSAVWSFRTGAAPASLTVSPSTASGASQAFTFTLTTLGTAWVEALVGATQNAAAGCQVHYDVANRTVYLLNETATGWMGPQAIGSGGTLENSRCRLNAGASSAVVSGLTLTLVLGLEGKTPFLGIKTIWAAYALTSGAINSWQQAGTWEVTNVIAPPPVVNVPPTSDSVFPASGSGSSQTFTFTFSDANGASDMTILNALIGAHLDARNACYFAYVRATNLFYLVDNAGTGLLGGIALGTVADVSNSQCTVRGATSSVAIGANSIILTLDIAFTASFGGAKVFYCASRDASTNSGWQPLASWVVPGAPAQVLSVTSLTPSRGTVSQQQLVLTANDTRGAGDIGIVNLLINSQLNGAGACYLAYVRAANVFYLVTDNGLGLTAPLAGFTNSFIENSQCRLDGIGSSASVAGNSIVLTMNLTFKPGFAGNKVMYAAVRDNGDTTTSGWVPGATWTVP